MYMYLLQIVNRVTVLLPTPHLVGVVVLREVDLSQIPRVTLLVIHIMVKVAIVALAMYSGDVLIWSDDQEDVTLISSIKI